MKISEVLRLARANFDNGHRYVCSAINELKVSDSDKEDAKEYVMNLLEGYSSVMLWVASKVHFKTMPTEEQRNDYRKRWMEHMIAELEKEGK